jgi:hypothetical protein
MRRQESKQLKLQSAALFMAVLMAAVGLIAAMASGCDTNDVTIHDGCPDAGAQDGGGGEGGSGVSSGTYCE